MVTPLEAQVTATLSSRITGKQENSFTRSNPNSRSFPSGLSPGIPTPKCGRVLPPKERPLVPGKPLFPQVIPKLCPQRTLVQDVFGVYLP